MSPSSLAKTHLATYRRSYGLALAPYTYMHTFRATGSSTQSLALAGYDSQSYHQHPPFSPQTLATSRSIR